MNTGSIALDPFPGRERSIALTAGLILTIVFVAALAILGGEPEVLVLAPAIAFLLLMQSNFEIALFGLVAALFVDFHLSYFSSAVWMSIPFATAFLLNARGTRWKEFSSPVNVPLALYGVLILPSFLNAADPGRSVAWLFNILAFALVFFTLVAGVRSRAVIRRAVAGFLALALLNAANVLVVGLMTGKREFGFAGVMFVDYAGLAVTLTAAISLCARGTRRILPLLACLLLAASLILTQTRNAWISTGVTLFILGAYVLLHPDVVGISRARFGRFAIAGVLVIGLALWSLTELNPEIQRRAVDLGEVETSGSSSSVVIKNSLITRLMIWDTALQAFFVHPIVGVGVYGFASSSAQYARIPSQFYRDYVEGLSPHIAYLAVLTETGILGTIGFLLVLAAGLRTAGRSIRRSTSGEQRTVALAGAAGVVYCCVSMAMTDAWLWGQGIVLFGLTLGLVTSHAKIPDEPVAGEADGSPRLV